MPDQLVPTPTTTPEVPVVPNEPATPTETAPLTRQEVLDLIASSKTEVESNIRRELENAYKAARRGEAKGDTAQKAVAKLETQLADVATRGMDESEARLWKAQRAEERAAEASSTVSQEQEWQRAASDFQQRSNAYLTSEGIKPDDPMLTAAFSKYASEARSYGDWDNALARAVADVHKDRAKRLTEEQKTLSDKVREEERAKLRNEQRSSEGPVDKGTPASASRKNVWDMTEDEFKQYDQQRDQERKTRQRSRR